MPGRTEFTHALLLRTVDYGEADRIVTLLTVAHGKVACIARGARRSRRRFGSALEPFQLLNAEIGAGKGQLQRLAQAQVVRAFPEIMSSLERMEAAGGALEIVREASPDRHADPALFATTVHMLEALGGPGFVPGLLPCFALRVMTLVGFGARLDSCGPCGKRPSAEQAARFDPRGGHLVCSDCGRGPELIGGSLRKALVGAQHEQWLQAAEAIDEGELAAARRIVRAFVEHRLEKALTTKGL